MNLLGLFIGITWAGSRSLNSAGSLISSFFHPNSCFSLSLIQQFDPTLAKFNTHKLKNSFEAYRENLCIEVVTRNKTLSFLESIQVVFWCVVKAFILSSNWRAFCVKNRRKRSSRNRIFWPLTKNNNWKNLSIFFFPANLNLMRSDWRSKMKNEESPKLR